MKLILSTLILLVTSVVVFAQPTFDKAKIDSYFDVLEANSRIMGSLMLSKDGNIIYQRSLGYARISETGKLKNNSGTKYRMASVTKLFTSVMIFQLIEEGKLALDTKLSKFFPQIANSDKITIDNLLSHTGGVLSFELTDDYDSWSFQPQSKEEMVKRFAKYKPQFSPGEKWSYSNTGYVLLAFIIEAVTNSTYSDELDKRIVNKIGLRNTHSGLKKPADENVAFSYKIVNGKWELERPRDLSAWVGAADIISNPNDLNFFMAALFGHKLISDASLKIMTTASSLNSSVGKDIFRGNISNEIAKETFLHHGGLDEFVSYTSFLPEGGYALSFCFNGNNFYRGKIFFAVWNAVFQKPITIPSFTIINLPADKLSKFEGVYRSANNKETAILKREKETLTFKFSNMKQAIPLLPIDELTFINNEFGRTLEFRKNADGTVQSFRHFYGRGESAWARSK